MNTLLETTITLSEAARNRIVETDGGAFLLNNWERVVMVHYEVDAQILQTQIPFELDTRDGNAYVSAVAFTMTNLRPRIGGRLAAIFATPVSNHEFLNVRTYVRHGDESGIYFLAEWLPNRLSVFFAPKIYGLPYQFGVANYQHHFETNTWNGEVTATDEKQFSYHASAVTDCDPMTANAGSLDEFLLERYTAFTERGGVCRLFRVWHEPWRFIPLRVTIEDDRLLASTGSWLPHANFVSAHYCFDARDVWMSRPRKLGRVILPCLKAIGVLKETS